ncbi:50S ribosomal protein L29 [candidate division WWE3 bacterium RIFCSPHIGHO2_12_FULL_38_15]|uniref:Large ribosomal subunit protein uL29 n=1 Tax=candidate division WWE3 bacterium RIFCSPHIGHO2_02_FULL_38_14 TaxID=1802620 RepID=A0A1F4VB47_UNCKA|nr:MAG: 50S ribosomal protein L29 [candidate division WWE3 bacterium RIFCSPHIGHO2_01_FULL_38_45]OGC49083.1 MAG: 50S ribosomal protein L29 [candidate division WWE3 bacterium RIFCSPHIGHO2_12_FULL_38_15]OGC53538.1 MAG: 50S ribosomal protein L29 [candidate division WWE3 bacterium RIFCSPLOWO2_01_FULL_37_24]OGC54442.1 MAG: 50S ribosomal protein L29 [candidate division WWE3 bacterium RIFCSPHIGHO2_02_FULL_38_14]HLB51688.1 50S ribosomal protein L29 [Patescibacteria group bacterium]
MKSSDLRNKSEKELKDLIQKTAKELEDVVTDVIKGKEKNIRKIRPLKKDIARLKTLLSEKEFLSKGGNINA